MMKDLMHKMFLSCLKATELIEKKFHIELSLKERLQLKVHTMMCNACSNYEKQSEVLESGLKKVKSEKVSKEDVTELKSKILEKLEK